MDAAVNPNNDRDRGNLFDEITRSRDILRPFRMNREEAIREYCGSKYADFTTRYETYCNNLELTAEAYTTALAANRPQYTITTEHAELMPFAKRFEIALNNLVEKIDLDQTLQDCVLDAFFGGLGICKVYMSESVQVEVGDGIYCDPGRPFAGKISLDDWVHDASAKEWRKVRFAGDRYRLPFWKLEENPDVFKRDVVKLLRPTSPTDGNEWGADPKVRDISQGTQANRDQNEFEPTIDLMDVWLPEEGLLVTWPAYKQSKPLAVRECDNPESGPYKLLSLISVPDNIMPKSPVGSLIFLHQLANRLLRKLSRQASQQRDIPVYTGAGQADAQRLQKAQQGEWTRVQNKDQVGVLKFGGIDVTQGQFFDRVTQIFSRQAGNLDAMAGLGPQAQTLGQDELIHGAVSRKEAKMQGRVLNFARSIGRDLGWLKWVDQVLEVPGNMSGPGGVKVRMDWTPELREGDFLDYNFEVEPHSMAYTSPSEKVAKLNQVLANLAPMMPMFEQQGSFIDPQEIVDIYASFLNLPELKRVIKFTEPPHTFQAGVQQPGASATKERRVAPNTTRTNIRRDAGKPNLSPWGKPTAGAAMANSGAVQSP